MFVWCLVCFLLLVGCLAYWFVFVGWFCFSGLLDCCVDLCYMVLSGLLVRFVGGGRGGLAWDCDWIGFASCLGASDLIMVDYLIVLVYVVLYCGNDFLCDCLLVVIVGGSGVVLFVGLLVSIV